MSVGHLQIIRVVAEHYGLTTDKLKFRRTPQCARARHVAMWLVRDLLQLSYPAIGQAFERDHSTVMSGCAHVEALFDSTVEFQAEIALLKAKVGKVWHAPEAKRCDHCGQSLLAGKQLAIGEVVADLEGVTERLRLLRQP